MEILNTAANVGGGGVATLVVLLLLKKWGVIGSSQPDMMKDNFTEYLEAVRQSGKQEFSGLYKEINKKMDFYHADHIKRLDKIDVRLEQQNGKVFKNHDDIQENKKDIAVLKAINQK